jgi:hypothetical protein
MAEGNAKKKTWTVTLNAGAMQLEGPQTREVTADRVVVTDHRVTFYDGDEVVAFYLHVLGLDEKTK